MRRAQFEEFGAGQRAGAAECGVCSGRVFIINLGGRALLVPPLASVHGAPKAHQLLIANSWNNFARTL
jgi:hypothetical protein